MISVLGVIACMLALAAGAGSSGERESATSLSEQDEFCSYIIQKGDTLSNIAARLTGKAEYYPAIMRHNTLTSEVIYPGGIVRIPHRLLLPQYRCALDAQQSRSDAPETPAAPPQNSNDDVLADIEGLVFEDRNGNGEHDAGEPGVSEIKLVLVREGDVLTSDEDGLVLFTEVEPGDHAVGLEESSIPKGYRLCTKSTVLLSVVEGDKGYAAFGICGAASAGTSD